MAWIELHQSLFTHRKTVEAALALDLPEVYVVGHLAALWTWALDNAPDGILRAAEPVIERICQWTGERGALVKVLVDVGFLHATKDGWRIHDWFDYAGRLMDQRKRNAARMRATRTDTREGRQHEEKEEGASHVHRTCSARAPHVHLLPYPTQPYRTRPYQTRENIYRHDARFTKPPVRRDSQILPLLYRKQKQRNRSCR